MRYRILTNRKVFAVQVQSYPGSDWRYVGRNGVPEKPNKAFSCAFFGDIEVARNFIHEKISNGNNAIIENDWQVCE